MSTKDRSIDITTISQTRNDRLRTSFDIQPKEKEISIDFEYHEFFEDDHVLILFLLRSTFPRLVAPTARARTAGSTPSTRSPNTRLARYDKKTCSRNIHE